MLYYVQLRSARSRLFPSVAAAAPRVIACLSDCDVVTPGRGAVPPEGPFRRGRYGSIILVVGSASARDLARVSRGRP